MASGRKGGEGIHYHRVPPPLLLLLLLLLSVWNHDCNNTTLKCLIMDERRNKGIDFQTFWLSVSLTDPLRSGEKVFVWGFQKSMKSITATTANMANISKRAITIPAISPPFKPIHVCVHTYIHVHIYIHTHTYFYTCILHTCTYIHTYKHIYIVYIRM